MYKLVGNVALNDLHLFDLQTLQWVTVAIYRQDGAYPLSRWGQSLVTYDGAGGTGSGDTMILFGGCNLKSYCEGSVLYEITLNEIDVAHHYEETEQKIQMLAGAQRES